jgi:N-acetylglucosamine-6-phosphate deacetylase
MPSRISGPPSPTKKETGITKFTNCFLVRGNKLMKEDLWVSSVSGKILESQEIFYEHRASADRIVDLEGKILAPGFIDVQFNGAYGFDFSVEQEDIVSYAKGVRRVNENLIKTGVTSYLPTVTSQRAEVYPQIIPYLGPSGQFRNSRDGAESLGAHIEGPFLSPTKNGIHKLSVLRESPNGFTDLEACYGSENLKDGDSPIKLITLAPELPGILQSITELSRRGIVVSIGHSEATYELACEAVSAGASMITHLFNAMRPLHHRNPGIFGLLGTTSTTFQKPFFGIIADGIHLHSTSIKIAWNAHPDGCILVTDAMRFVGMPDGTYDWTNGERIIKKGPLLTLEGTDGKIAGSSISLVECVTNFLNWTGATIPEAIQTVTSTPAKMLGLGKTKGCLAPGADADLVVLDVSADAQDKKKVTVEQVWKFGKMVYSLEKSA